MNEHYRLEVAIYEVEEDLLLSGMRRFVREETAPSSPGLSFISGVKQFARSVGDKFVRLGVDSQPLMAVPVRPEKNSARAGGSSCDLLITRGAVRTCAITPAASQAHPSLAPMRLRLQ